MRTEGLIIYSPAIILVLTGNLAALEGFQLLQRARPLLSQQPRESPVRQYLAARLAARTVVGFIAGITNAQHLLAASRAWLPIAPVHGHPVAERGHLLREFLPGFGAQPGNFCRASARSRSSHSVRVSRVAACSRSISSAVSLRVCAMGDRRAACRISSE